MDSKAKMNVLKELRKMAMDDMGEPLKGASMKKVTVAAPDKKGLEQGLDKAEAMISDPFKMDEDEENLEQDYSDEESEADPFMEMVKGCSPEELDEKIEMLKQMKMKMGGESESEDDESNPFEGM
jgi:hypothetical protein